MGWLNPSEPSVIMWLHLAPYRPNIPLALRAERQSARMSETVKKCKNVKCKNGVLGLYGAEHSKCNDTHQHYRR